jgi:hypothetical protein
MLVENRKIIENARFLFVREKQLRENIERF